jgi:hypothetical protein
MPMNPLDAMLSECFRSGDPSHLDRMVDGVPAGIAATLRAAVTGDASSEEFYQAAQFLVSRGLHFAALAAIECALPTLPWGIAVYAKFLELRLSIQEQAGMEWSAQASARLIARLMGEMDRSEALPLIAHDRLIIVDTWNRPKDFAALSARHTVHSLTNDPLRDPGLTKTLHHRGTLACFVGIPVDFSFFVLDRDHSPLLQVECDTSHIWNPIRCREAPVVFSEFGAPLDSLRVAVPLALEQLRLIAAWTGARGIQLDLAPNQRSADRILAPLIVGLEPFETQMVRGGVTLSRSVDEILASYCQNHRRSIRKSLPHIGIKRFARGDVTAIAHYQTLHEMDRRIQPLPPGVLADLIQRDDYVMYGAFRCGEPVGMLTVTRHGSVAYYSAGVMVSHESIPVGHLLMHHAIIDAKTEDADVFDFGLIDVDPRGDRKKLSIGRFKLGFCDTVSDHQIVYISV